MGAHATQSDDAGFYSTSTRAFRTSSQAMVADDVDLGADPAGSDRLPGVLEDVKLRVTATGTAGKPVFVGIGRREDVDAHLAGAAHDRIDDVNFSPFPVDYRPVPGQVRLAPPARQPFWAASATGPGPQAATWRVDEGECAVVVMNADASDGVTASPWAPGQGSSSGWAWPWPGSPPSPCSGARWPFAPRRRGPLRRPVRRSSPPSWRRSGEG